VLAQNGGSDIYLAKFNSSGVHQWSKHFGGANADSGQALALDPAGNVFLTGYFTGTADFGGGGLVSAGGYDMFLAKYSTAGTFAWAKSFAGPNFEAPNSVTVDASSNVVFTGYFQNTLNVGGTILSSAGGTDIAIGKFSNGGTLAWAKSFGGTGGDTPLSIDTDANGYVVCTGQFAGTANFGGTSLISAGSTDIYLIRIAP